MEKTICRKGLAAISLVLAGAAVLGGCGSDNKTQAPAAVSGRVTQGPVKGAIVFADHLTGGVAFKMDDDEKATQTTTDASGNFTLPVTPTYAYRIVTIGGIDTVTNQPAIQLVAPQGAKNISPLTTLVALDTTGKVKTLIASLGVNYDDDISQKVTPAALLLVKSVESTVAAVTKTLTSTGTGLTIDQVNAVQQTVVSQISAQLQDQTAANVTNAPTLATKLQDAVSGALTAMTASGSSLHDVVAITVTADALAQTIVPATLVTTIGTQIGDFTQTASTSAVTETSLIDSTKAATIDTSVTDAANQSKTNVNITQPVANTAPTLTGAPDTSVTVGQNYTFAPKGADVDGDTLTFTATNVPSWATFNAATGAITGKPTSAGTSDAIVISVTDGINTVSLPAFTITVNAATGSTGGTGASGATGTGLGI